MSRGRRGGRGRGRGGQGGGQGHDHAPGQPHPQGQPGAGGAQGGGGHGGGGGGGPSGTGILEVDDRGRGFLRNGKRQFEPQHGDPVINADTVRRFDLRPGSEVVLEGGRVVTIDGMDPEKAREVRPFKLLTTIDPVERYVMEGPDGDVSMRVIDLICPVGRGSRALVVAPVGSSRVDLQACKLEYSIVSPK